jgi:hypothetical protein
MHESIDDLLVQHADDLVNIRSHLAKEWDGPMPDDILLLRYLFRSTVQKAIPRVKAMVQWRHKNHADVVAERIVREKLTPDQFPYAKEMQEYFPQNLLFGFTNKLSPFSVDYYGRIQTTTLVNELTYEQFFEYNLYRLEYMRILLDNVTKHTRVLTRWCVIADLSGLAMKQFNKTFLQYLQVC